MEQTYKKIKEVYISEDKIRERVAELGRQITEDYYDKNLLLVCVLKGSAVFAADLMREIKIPVEIDYMAASSYGASTVSSKTVQIVKSLPEDLSQFHVLVIEDILDTGRTLTHILEAVRKHQPLSLAVCAFLDKPDRRVVPIHAAYVGFTIEDKFVVGYGLDFNQKYRNLSYIGIYND